jgi:Reverse transcriptase (RNA-dependent DNA polymerase).
MLVNEQFEFRTKLSTEKVSFKLHNEILNALNNKLMAGGNFCDLEKAFDYVDHDILLSKLKFYRVTGKTFLSIKSYLQDRHYKVILKDKYANHNPYTTAEKYNMVASRIYTGTIALLNLP